MRSFPETPDRDVLFVLGANDAEMSAIEGLLADHNVPFVHAQCNGQRLGPGQLADIAAVPSARKRVWVEVPNAPEGPGEQIIDHHGITGFATYGPAFYWEASSLGQTHEWLYWAGHNVGTVSQRHAIIAALDHCPAAAFRGLCPGVALTPGSLGRRLAFNIVQESYAPHLDLAEFAYRVGLSAGVLRTAPSAFDLDSDGMVKDLTALEPDGDPVAGTGEIYPSLFSFGPFVGAMEGLGYLVRIRRKDGLLALRIGGCGAGSVPGEAPIHRWLRSVGEMRGCLPRTAQNPNNLFGFPIRGMAGGTLREQEAPWRK